MMRAKFLSLIFMLGMVVSLSATSSDYPLSDHYDGKLFHNPKGDHLQGFLEVLKWKWNATPAEWPEVIENKNFKLTPLAENSKGVVTFINHATFLLQLPGLTILTDPVYSERVSPFRFMGPKRIRVPGITLDDLPPIDVIIVSHNHYDHMDLETLKIIDGKFHPLVIVPLGNAALLKSEGIRNVHEIDWWQDIKVRENRITLTPSEHWSSRTLWDKNEALWGCYMIQTPQLKIFFGGDTGYGGHFLDVKSRLGAPDAALLPIGSYEPRWFMKFHHMNPAEAVQAHLDLGAAKSFGMHFGTFHLSDEGVNEPESALKESMKKNKIDAAQFTVPEQGESFIF